MSNWISLTLSGEDLEEKCSLLFDMGVCGTTFTQDGLATCYLNADEPSSEIKAQLERLCLKLEKTEPIVDSNWTQLCQDLFEEVKIQSLSIVPVKGFEDSKISSSSLTQNILIIPGMGFGTGHHSTTYNLISMLQSDEVKTLSPQTVLDAGSGSGILAIAACKLSNCTVDAYEVDTYANENCRDNLKLNKLEARVRVVEESVHKCESRYDLVIANLYAELLEMLSSHLVSLINPGGQILLSGIRQDLTASVLEKYCSHGLSCIAQREKDGWAALHLKY